MEVGCEGFQRGGVEAIPDPTKVLSAVRAGVFLVEVKDFAGGEIKTQDGGAGGEANGESVGQGGFACGRFTSEGNERATGDEVGDEPIHDRIGGGEKVDDVEGWERGGECWHRDCTKAQRDC